MTIQTLFSAEDRRELYGASRPANDRTTIVGRASDYGVDPDACTRWLCAELAAKGLREFANGPTRELRAIVELILKIAKLSATVLIMDEGGAASELLARVIHHESGWSGGPAFAIKLTEKGFVRLELLFRGQEIEAPPIGTVYLDDVAGLSLSSQERLLHLLQQQEVYQQPVLQQQSGDSTTHRTFWRIIAATRADLEDEVEAGRFLESLYYLLNVIPIRVPSSPPPDEPAMVLRDRPPNRPNDRAAAVPLPD